MAQSDWRTIAEQASKETKPSKLMVLINQLFQALDDRKHNLPATSRTPDSEAND